MASKTQQFDDTIIVANNSFPWLPGLLLVFLRARQMLGLGPDACLRPFSLEELRHWFQLAFTALGLDFCLYMLRHGGAANDLLQKFRLWEEIRNRGRWMCDSSVRRYAKAGTVQRAVQKMPPAVVKWGSEMLQHLQKALLDQKVFPPPNPSAEVSGPWAVTSSRRPSQVRQRPAAIRLLTAWQLPAAGGSMVIHAAGDLS